MSTASCVDVKFFIRKKEEKHKKGRKKRRGEGGMESGRERRQVLGKVTNYSHVEHEIAESKGYIQKEADKSGGKGEERKGMLGIAIFFNTIVGRG